MVSELDALGDELLLDDDSSYLDEASAAPSIPEGIPSDSKTNKVKVFRAPTLYSTQTGEFKQEIFMLVFCILYVHNIMSTQISNHTAFFFICFYHPSAAICFNTFHYCMKVNRKVRW